MHGISFRARFSREEELLLFAEYKGRRQLDLASPELNLRREYRQLEDQLFAAYLPLVTVVAQKVYRANREFLIDVDELVSAGYMGLLNAFRGFDPERGLRFATYATWWILNEISQAAKAERWMIGISDYRYRGVRKVARAMHHLEQILVRRPTTTELSSSLEMPAQRVTHLFAWLGRQTISVDTPVGRGSSTLGDFIEDSRAIPPIVALENSNVLQWIMQSFECLTDREQTVLRYRFGLLGVEALTVDEVAKQLNVTPSGVRYIQARAFKKLKMKMVAASGKPTKRPRRRAPSTAIASRNASSESMTKRTTNETNTGMPDLAFVAQSVQARNEFLPSVGAGNG